MIPSVWHRLSLRVSSNEQTTTASRHTLNGLIQVPELRFVGRRLRPPKHGGIRGVMPVGDARLSPRVCCTTNPNKPGRAGEAGKIRHSPPAGGMPNPVSAHRVPRGRGGGHRTPGCGGETGRTGRPSGGRGEKPGCRWRGGRGQASFRRRFRCFFWSARLQVEAREPPDLFVTHQNLNPPHL